MHNLRVLRVRYKKLLNKKKRFHTQEVLKQLDNLHDNNPRAYWNIFDKLKERKKNPNTQIDSEDWINYFPSLMNKNADLDKDHLHSIWMPS